MRTAVGAALPIALVLGLSDELRLGIAPAFHPDAREVLWVDPGVPMPEQAESVLRVHSPNRVRTLFLDALPSVPLELVPQLVELGGPEWSPERASAFAATIPTAELLWSEPELRMLRIREEIQSVALFIGLIWASVSALWILWAGFRRTVRFNHEWIRVKRLLGISERAIQLPLWGEFVGTGALAVSLALLALHAVKGVDETHFALGAGAFGIAVLMGVVALFELRAGAHDGI